MADPPPPPPGAPPVVVQHVGDVELGGLNLLGDQHVEVFAVIEAENAWEAQGVDNARQALPVRPHDGNPSTMRAGGRYGDASVSPVNTFEFSLKYSEARHDFLAYILNLTRGMHNRIGLFANEIRITNTIVLERLGAAAPSARLGTNIPLRTPRLPAMGVFAIKWTNRAKRKSLDVTKIDAYITSNSVDARVVAGSLRGDRVLGRAVSERLVASFRQSTDLFDNIGLFTCGHLLVFHLITLALNNTPIDVGVVPNNAILLANLAVDDLAAADVVNNVNIALSHKYICLDASLLSRADWYLIFVLASGLPFYTGPADDENQTIFRQITSEGIRFLIYDDKPIVQPPVGIPTGSAILASLRRMAEFLQDEDGFVRGYIRACSIAFGKLSTEGGSGRQEKRFFTAGFETGVTRFPNPGGYNPLWQLLKLGPSSKASEPYQRDWEAMTSFDLGDLIRVGVVTAGLYSLGVSAVFHNINITGRELNAWANRTASVSTNLLNDLFTKQPDMSTIPLNLAAVGFVQQATKSILSADPYYAITFSGSWVDQPALIATTGWQNAFGIKIPYIYEPLSLQWILEKWPSIYGYSGIGPEVELGVELIMSDADAGNQFSFWQGDSKYLEVAAGPRPYIFIPYAWFLANIILQDQRAGAMPAFAYTPIYKSGGSRAAIGPLLINDVALQPDYYADIFSLKVGTPTYDWARGCVLGPVWVRNQIPNNIWEFLTRQEHWKALYAGFMGKQRSERAISGYSIGLVTDLIVGGASRSASRRNAEDEEGN